MAYKLNKSIATFENPVNKYIPKCNRFELINQGFIPVLWLWSKTSISVKG